MKKLRLIGLVLLLITILYVVAFRISAQNYKAWCEESPYDYYPFRYTEQGKIMVLLGLAIFVSWVGFLSFRLDTFISKRKRKTQIAAIALAAFSLSLCFTTLPVAQAGYTEKYVDALVVRDEEWKAGWGHCHVPGLAFPLPLPYNETAKTAMKLTAERFHETFGIEIRWHYWVEWDSDDNEEWPDDLLDEAITETGFQPGMSYNSYIIDVLVVFTGQDLVAGYHGFSYPPWKALIIEYITHEDEDESLQHEFSHQFYAEHCSNWCVMNVEAIFNLLRDVKCWCSSCQTTINGNADRFWRWIPGGGGYCPTLFVWNGSEYVEEALLDIHADTDVTLQHTIAETLVSEKNSYKLSLRELDEFTSHIDQVKLYVVDDDGEMRETHLTKAVHSLLGDVKEPLLHDDDTRLDLTPQQTVDLEFTVPNIDDVACFTFEINGCNWKTPQDENPP